MKIKVKYREKTKSIHVPEGSNALEAVKKMDINPETVIVKRGNDILLETDKIRKNDDLEFIRIISGG